MKPRLRLFLLLGLVAFIVVNGLTSIRNKTITYDEHNHLAYGKQMLELNSWRFDDSKMPVSALNAIPQKLADLLPENPLTPILKKPQMGRPVTLAVSILLALLVFHWAKSLYGAPAGLLALFLYAFDPNITAHAQLITTDLYAAITITLAGYTFWRFARKRSWKNGLICAIALGLAQIAKYTAVFLYVLFPLLLLVHDGSYLLSTIRRRRQQVLLSYTWKGAVYLLVFALVSLLIINIGFLFNQTMTPFGAYQFRSELFQSFQTRTPALASVRIPLPYPYVEGLDWIVYKERTGIGYGRIYMLGHLRQKGQGFIGYFFAAYLFKVPLAAQVLTWAAAVMLLRKFSWNRLRRRELFLLGPVIFFLIYFNFFYKAQIGIRFILMIFPMIYVFTSGLVQQGITLSRRSRIALAALSVYLIGSVLSYYPQYLAYFNELVPDRRMAYKIIADSNLDWGQNGWYLEKYLNKHNGASYNPAYPVSGTIVVSVNDLVGITSEPEKFEWLRDNFSPTDTIEYSYLIFEVTPEKLEEIMH